MIIRYEQIFNGFDSNVFLAPMAGITDKPMRRLVSSMGPGTMVSEMVAINAISRKNPKSYRIADVRDEPYKVVVQLVGGNEGLLPIPCVWRKNSALIP